MDLTNYYELKHQPHNLRLLAGAGLNIGGAEREDSLAPPHTSCSASSSSMAPIRAASCQSSSSLSDAIMMSHHFLDGAPPKTAVISGADGRMSDHHLEELYKERWEGLNYNIISSL